MVDTSMAQDERTPQKQSATSNTTKHATRSDGGTVLLHWLTVASMLTSLFTGMRISADGPGTPLASVLDQILPEGEIWTWHIVAGLILMSCTTAYVAYLRRASLGDRNSAVRLRTLTPPTTPRLRLRAINVALHWFAYAAILTLSVSGIILYIGYGNWFVTVHRALAWSMLFYVLIHTAAHLIYGGFDQILRLFRPEPLVESQRTSSWPTALALAIGAASAIFLYALDTLTQPVLKIGLVSTAPVLDGNLNDQVWAASKPVSVSTHQGFNLGGSGSSQVSIRAVRTKNKIHFAFQWQDPSRSLMRSPTIKREDGWHVMSTGNAVADINDYYEDKFAILFSHNDQFGGGRSTFLGKNPLPSYPKSPHGRGLHYTDDGRVMDLWQWKSSRGGMLGHVDDMYFGPPVQPTHAQQQGKSRYSAGYTSDPGKAIYEYNYIADGPDGYDSPVRLKRLPADLAKFRIGLGTIPADPNGNNDETSNWWMTRENSVEYSTALDAAIPLGTILPSTLNIHSYQGDRADLAGAARWKNGLWTVEATRNLVTGSPYDIAFRPGTRVFAWVSVFDHNQTRHTRHQRAIELQIS